MLIVDDDLLFLSTGADFIAPTMDDSAAQSSAPSHSEAGTEAPKPVDIEHDKVPSTIAGYRVGKVLGRGAFGEVRVGEHQLTGEKVALKFLRKAEIQSIGAAERTTIEIQCLSTLKHANIIRLQQVDIF